MADKRYIQEETDLRTAPSNPETCIGTVVHDRLASLPSWAREIMRSKSGDTTPVRGRILKLKLGYNPNSSSVGSGVYVLPVILLGITTLFGAAAGIISSAFAHGRRKQVPRKSKDSA